MFLIEKSFPAIWPVPFWSFVAVVRSPLLRCLASACLATPDDLSPGSHFGGCVGLAPVFAQGAPMSWRGVRTYECRAVFVKDICRAE